MRTPSFHSERLREFLRLKKIATLPELKEVLGTTVDTTVFRKLKELSYRSSYSHRGRYYTLPRSLCLILRAFGLFKRCASLAGGIWSPPWKPWSTALPKATSPLNCSRSCTSK